MTAKIGLTVSAVVLGLCALARAQPVAWTQRAVSGPSPRNSHAMAYDEARGETVLFGGYDGSPDHGDTWEWNGTVWTRRVVTGPSARGEHAMVYDAARSVTVLFGGYDGSFNGVNGEIWEWDGTAWTQRADSGPPARYRHAMAYDAARGVTVLFGGYAGGNYYGDTWEWNGSTWTQRVVSGPSPRAFHAMAYDAARGMTVLFGGSSDAGRNDETWEWNGTTWTQRVVSGPSPRRGHAMDYDTARGVTVVFGGLVGTFPSYYNAETWEWNGTTWTQRAVSGPLPRDRHAMAYDTARGLTVLFGGYTDGGYNGETWELCTAPSFTAQLAAQTVCPGGSASFTVTAAGTGPLAYQWRKDSVNLADEPFHISGANAVTLVIMNISHADYGSYACVVSNACGSVTSNDASLTISPADFNRDGIINSQDFFNFLACFFNPQICALPLTADFNHDGTINSQDFFDFLAAFFVGC